MNDPYSTLGVPKGATDEEIKDAYRNLVKKYHPDNYSDDNPLKELAKEKMQQINTAYDQIQSQRASGGENKEYREQSNQGYQYTGVYAEVRHSINARKFKEAEQRLMGVEEGERTADWHFLYSVCLMQRGMVNDAMRELEIACSMDPSNLEYQRAKEQFNGRTSAYGSTYYGDGHRGYRHRSSTDDACDCCTNLICMDCCCEILGGDLIPCL